MSIVRNHTSTKKWNGKIMKAIFTILAFICANLSMKAQLQENIFRLEGKVFDYITRVQLPGSLVEVLSSDSTVIASKEASSKWQSGDKYEVSSDFSMSIPRKEGDYILRFTKEGFDPTYVNVKLHKFYKREFSRMVEPVYLRRMKVMNLDEVTLTATRVKFYHKGDTLIYHADAFQLSEGSMLDALIRQLSGAELRKDGRIYVNGRFVQSLLLNGKDFFRGNNQIMLDNLPTYMVSEVQTYDKLGDDSKFVGQEVGNDRTYVMDVKLKKQYSIGWVGNMEAGGGTKDRYLARLFALRFTDHSRVAVYGNINNVNDSRKPGENDNWSPSDLVGGLTRQKLAGLDYSITPRSQKYQLNGNAQVSHADNTIINNTTRTNFLPGKHSYDRIIASAHNRNLELSTNHRFYFESKNYNLEIKPYLSYRKSDNRREHSSVALSKDISKFTTEQLDSLFLPFIGEKLRKSMINRSRQEALERGYSLQTSLDAKLIIKFKHTSDFLTLSANASYQDASNKIYDRYSINYYNIHYPFLGIGSYHITTDSRERYFHNRPDRGYNYTAKAAYWFCIKKGLNLNMSYQYDRSYTSRYSNLYRLDQLTDWKNLSHDLGSLPSVTDYQKVMDASNSYDSHQTDNRHTIEPLLVWNKNTKKSIWRAQLAIPVTLLSRTLHYTRGSVDTTFTKRTPLLNMYSTFLKWSSTDHKYEVNFQYAIDSKAPDMNQYVNIKDTSDPLNITLGNSALKTSYSHELMMSFTRIYPQKGLMWAGEVLFNPIQNAIAMGYQYDRETGKRTFRPDNVNGNWNGRLSLGGGGALNKQRTLNFKAVVGAGYNRNVDLVGVERSSASNRSVVKTFSLMEKIQLDYRIGKSTIGLKTGSTWNEATGTRKDFESIRSANFSYGVTAKVHLPWELQLGTDLSMYSRRGYSDEVMNTDDLVWNARLSRPFFKGKFVMMVDGFDILGQLSNITRTLNAQARTEVYSNVIPRYVMFHAIYRFNILPSSQKH